MKLHRKYCAICLTYFEKFRRAPSENMLNNALQKLMFKRDFVARQNMLYYIQQPIDT